MKRKDREVTGQENILAILEKCEVVRLGMCVDNQPYIVPMNFGVEVREGEVFIYFHCAREGRKLDMIEKNPDVCFEADCSYQRISGGTEACKYSAEYQCVMGEGTITVVETEAEKIRGLDSLMKRYGFQGKAVYNPQSLAAVKVLRLAVTRMSGKQKS